MERRPNSRSQNPDLDPPIYDNVSSDDLNTLRTEAMRVLTGTEITKKELKKFALRANDPSIKHFDLPGGVVLYRLLFPNGSFTEMYRTDTLDYRISYRDRDQSAEVKQIPLYPKAQIPPSTHNSVNNTFIES